MVTSPPFGSQSTHFGSIKNFSQASSLFSCKIEWNAADKTPANAGLDLIGMCRMVLQGSRHTSSKEGSWVVASALDGLSWLSCKCLQV